MLSDNGASYVSREFADWLIAKGMVYVRGASYHPQLQGKIERWHQTLKNRILLEIYFLPGDFNASIERSITHYNHRYHVSLQNLMPLTFTSGKTKPFYSNAKGLNRKYSKQGVCNIATKSLYINK